jgi:hypothetical protein
MFLLQLTYLKLSKYKRQDHQKGIQRTYLPTQDHHKGAKKDTKQDRAHWEITDGMSL